MRNITLLTICSSMLFTGCTSSDYASPSADTVPKVAATAQSLSLARNNEKASPPTTKLLKKNRSGARHSDQLEVTFYAAGQTWERPTLPKSMRKLYIQGGASDVKIGTTSRPSHLGVGGYEEIWGVLKAGQASKYKGSHLKIESTGPGTVYVHVEWTKEPSFDLFAN